MLTDAGNSSEGALPAHRSSAEGADPPTKRTTVRVTNVYATSWRLNGEAPEEGVDGHLRLWRLARHYRMSGDQLPRVLAVRHLDPATLEFRRWERPVTPEGARLWLFVLPSDRVVAAFSLDVACRLNDVIDLLEDCYFGDLGIGEETLESLAHELLVQVDGSTHVAGEFLPDRHQLVFDVHPQDAGGDECDDVIQRLVYRADLPYRKEFSAIRYPAELNRRPGWLAAVGPYVSVIWGHADFIENTNFLSAVQAVGAIAELRNIRQAAYRDVRLFRSEQNEASTRQRRRLLERLADDLSDAELELSYSVEAQADLGSLVPSLRVESFHNALFESMDMSAKAHIVGRILQRLERAIDAELTSIESVERRADEQRRLRWAVAVGFVSAVAVPIGLIFAFFGINASQVDPHRSIFDHHYTALYLVTVGLVFIATALSLGVYLQQRLMRRRGRQRQR